MIPVIVTADTVPVDQQTKLTGVSSSRLWGEGGGGCIFLIAISEAMKLWFVTSKTLKALEFFDFVQVPRTVSLLIEYYQRR
jgi:hypothetical protein